MWLMPMSGTPRASASPFAALSPTRSELASPGPYVTATASRASTPRIASATTPWIFSMWARLATSGTTPPYGRWSGICVYTTLDSTSRPSRTTAHAVSSQLLSIPRMFIFVRLKSYQNFHQAFFTASTPPESL